MKLFEMKYIKKALINWKFSKISLDVEEGEVLSIIAFFRFRHQPSCVVPQDLETPDSGEIIKNGDVGLVFQQFNSVSAFFRTRKYSGCTL